MPTHIFEMKILKHTFKLPKLKIEDGELLEDGYLEETYTFTLLHKGVGLYEELTNESLMASIIKCYDNGNVDYQNLTNEKFIKALACATYVKIDGDKFHNNRATAEEFSKKPVCQHLTKDIEFVKELIEMATSCIAGDKIVKKK